MAAEQPEADVEDPYSRTELPVDWATTSRKDRRLLAVPKFEHDDVVWALRDSNPRPPPCKGGALTN